MLDLSSKNRPNKNNDQKPNDGDNFLYSIALIIGNIGVIMKIILKLIDDRR